jgi:hypothetical protein
MAASYQSPRKWHRSRLDRRRCPNSDVRISLGDGNDDLAGILLRANASALSNGGGTDHFIENMLARDPLIIVGFEDFT